VRSDRPAFTLIEVVVGLVLMGSLVASAMVALASHQHSQRLARQKHLANRVAESLLTNWYELRGQVPIREQGTVSMDGEWLWRTQPVSVQTVCGLPVNVIRLEIVGRVGTRLEPRVLSSIELIQTPDASSLR